jgi:O-antigen/teichoic acid export membrane protein
MMRKSFDRLGRFFQTDFRYLVRGGSLLSMMHVTSALVSFGLTIAFANLIPPEVYGTYRYILSVYSLLGILVIPGIDTALVRAVSRGFEGSLIEAFRKKLRWGLLGSFGAFGVALYNFIQGETALAIVFSLVAIIIPVMEATSVYTSFLNGKKLYRPWVIMDIISLVVSGTILVTALFLTDSIILIMLAYFLPLISLRLIFFYRVVKFIEKPERDPELTTYGKQVTLFQIISRVIASIDQIVLFHFLGPVQLAVFSLAYAIPARAQGLLRIAGTLATPKFAVREPRNIAKTLGRKMLYFALFILFWSGVYILIAPWLFETLFPKYISSVPFSQILILFTLSSITYPFSALLFAHKRMRENYYIGIGSFLAKAIALAIFVPLFGIWGGVASVLAASLTTIVISLIFLRNIANEKPSKNHPDHDFDQANTDNELIDQ